MPGELLLAGLFILMLSCIYCIALRTVRVNDGRNLLSVWSRDHGRMTIAMPAGAGREAKRRRALTSPLALFEAVADLRPDREIVTVRDLLPLPSSPTMVMSPTRMAGATFLAEALDVLLRRTEVESDLSTFLFDAVAFYGEASVAAAANFHISFLCHLGAYMGIAPDTGQEGEAAVFDLREGRFAASPPLHGDYLSGGDARAVRILGRVPLRRCGLIKMPRYERRRALDTILHYYDLHLTSLDGLKSLEILRQIFD